MLTVNSPRAAVPALRRALGRWDLTALGINGVVAAGIFLIPSQLASHVGTSAPAAIVLAGLATLVVALCFAEIGSRFDRNGGPYVYTRAAFGPFVAFEVGWMFWLTRVTALASIVNGLALALSFYWPAVATGPPRAVVIVSVILALTALNVRGVKQGAWTVNVFTVAKLFPLLILVSAGLLVGGPGRLGPLTALRGPDVVSAGLLLVFLFGGFDMLTIVAGEARAPRRDVPFALVLTTLAVTALVALVQVTTMTALPDLATSKTPVADAAMVTMGPAGAALVSVGSIMSMAGANANSLMLAPRMVFALAENGELPGVFARVHPRWRTPDVAIWFTAAVALALALSGSFAPLAASTAVTRLLTYVGVSAATLVLRHPRFAGAVPAPLVVLPGGPALPLVAIALSLAIVLSASPAQWLFGAGGLVAGSLLYNARPRRRHDENVGKA